MSLFDVNEWNAEVGGQLDDHIAHEQVVRNHPLDHKRDIHQGDVLGGKSAVVVKVKNPNEQKGVKVNRVVFHL